MTEQAKLPDGSIDIVDKVRKLEAFIEKLLDGDGYKDADGILEVFTDEEIESMDCQGYPSHWTNGDGDRMTPHDGVQFDATCSDWLDAQLFIDVCYERTDRTKQDRNFNWVELYKVSGWCIEITCGGPSVRLKREPFSGCVTYSHSWGVVSWSDPSGHFSPRTSIEFNSALGDRIHEYIQELYS